MAKKKYSVEDAKPDLDIDEDLPLHEKGWAVQRVGWIVLALIVVSGALGAFGSGVLSKKKRQAGSAKAEYEFLHRYETEMRILLESGVHIGNISFTNNYLKHFRIVRFVPEPENNHTSGNDVVFNFLPGSNQIVCVYLVPKTFGSISGTMKINSTDSLVLSHLIYP